MIIYRTLLKRSSQYYVILADGNDIKRKSISFLVLDDKKKTGRTRARAFRIA